MSSLADYGAGEPGEPGGEPVYLASNNVPETQGEELDGFEDVDSIGDVPADKLRVYFQQYHGDVHAIADVAGSDITPDDIRERIAECQLHGDGIEPHSLAEKLPHDVGLAPLGCGECGAVEIVQHPCPECGYDPRGATDA